MEDSAKTPPQASVQDAIEAWRQLYKGEATAYPLVDSPSGLEAVAVRHADFRDEPGNWPKIFHHRRPTPKVLVLIHGLKDSPGYMEAIALRFAAQGANVVLPLLPAHGRKDPVAAMRRADHRAWCSTVDRAVEIAALLGREISIGGLSTGGALAIDKASRDPAAIAGKVFLFSAALGLEPFQRLVLSTAVVPRWADAWLARRPNNGIGGDPHKYTRTFFTGARQVHLLIDGIGRRAISDPDSMADVRKRIFVAHSEADQTINISAVRPFVVPDDPQQHHMISATQTVGHAELVMAEAMQFEKLWPDEPEPPRANPEFEVMMQKALAFFARP